MQKDGDKDSEVRAYNAAAAKHNYLIELIIHGKSCVCLNSAGLRATYLDQCCQPLISRMLLEVRGCRLSRPKPDVCPSDNWFPLFLLTVIDWEGCKWKISK
jgi:hypothetical protein